MSQPVFRAAIIASTVLLTIAVAIAFLGCPEVGSAYLMITGTAGNDLPALTANVSIPLFRISAEDAHERPITRPWVAIVWVFLAAFPIVIATWAFRAPRTEMGIARWVVGYGIYIPLVCVVSAVMLVGLALPFACM